MSANSDTDAGLRLGPKVLATLLAGIRGGANQADAAAETGADAGASAQGTASDSIIQTRSRANARIDNGRRAGANAQLRLQTVLQNRLAQIDRLRDKAVETGNQVLLDQADRMEAQARAAFQVALDAQVRRDGLGEIRRVDRSDSRPGVRPARASDSDDSTTGDRSEPDAVSSDIQIGAEASSRLNDERTDVSADAQAEGSVTSDTGAVDATQSTETEGAASSSVSE